MLNLIVRAFSTSALLAVCITLSTGCVSDHTSRALGEAVVTQVVAPPAELAVCAISFQRKNGRWPTGYAEIRAFAESELRSTLGKYDRVDFTERVDGSVEIYAVAPGITNRMTLSLKETTQK